MRYIAITGVFNHDDDDIDDHDDHDDVDDIDMVVFMTITKFN